MCIYIYDASHAHAHTQISYTHSLSHAEVPPLVSSALHRLLRVFRDAKADQHLVPAPHECLRPPSGRPMVAQMVIQWSPNGHPMVTQWSPNGHPMVTTFFQAERIWCVKPKK